MATNGRIEKELKSEIKMKIKLSGLPKIFEDFYYFMGNKSYLTKENYLGQIEDFMNFITEGIPSEDFYKNVSLVDINRYMMSLRVYTQNGETRRRSDSAMALRWSSLNAFFNFLALSGMIETNIVSKTDRPKIRDEHKKPSLTKKEISKMSSNIDNGNYHKNITRDKLIFSLGICTGLRVSAISQLNIDDIDLRNNRLQVIEKGDKYRVIEFGDNLHVLLEKYLEERNKYFPGIQTNALFISQKKQRITNNAIRNLLTKYANGATDKHVSAHTLRRTSANQLYSKTGDIYLVGNHLGHSDISTTKRYISIDEDKQKNKIAFMDTII